MINRAQFEKHVLDNKLMTKVELDQFMNGMKEKIHLGYPIGELKNFEKKIKPLNIFIIMIFVQIL